MSFESEIKKELRELKKTRKIILRNPIFINEEIRDLDEQIKMLEDILSVLK